MIVTNFRSAYNPTKPLLPRINADLLLQYTNLEIIKIKYLRLKKRTMSFFHIWKIFKRNWIALTDQIFLTDYIPHRSGIK
jgi:hypothetical protein